MAFARNIRFSRARRASAMSMIVATPATTRPSRSNTGPACFATHVRVPSARTSSISVYGTVSPWTARASGQSSGSSSPSVDVEALVCLAAGDVMNLTGGNAEDVLEPIVGEDDSAARGLGDHQAFRKLLEEGLESSPLRLEIGDQSLADAGQGDAGEGLCAEVGVGADERPIVRVEWPGFRE